MSTALVIIDIQNDYFPDGRNPLYNPEKTTGQVKKVLDLFREKKLPVFFIQHASKDADADFLNSDWGIKVNDAIAPIEGEKCIYKHEPSSFFETSLLRDLIS